MTFPLNLYLAAFFSAALLSWASTPLWIRICHRHGFIDDPGHRKLHSAPVPLAGGWAVLTGILVPVLGGLLLLVWRALPETALYPFHYGISHRAWQLTAILAGAVAMLLLGACDDRRELSPKTKFAGQLLIALAVAASGIRITLFVDNLLFSYLVTVLWILTLTNAFNFLDNMNGLTTGLGFISAFLFTFIAASQGQYLVTALACLTAGGLLGFLPHNFPRASSFLGDAGSHLTGFLIAVLAILPNFYSPAGPEPWAVLAPILILAVPLYDLTSVVWIRWRNGQPFYIGDTNHISHRLVARGCSKPVAVLLIWLIAAVIGSLVTLAVYVLPLPS